MDRKIGLFSFCAISNASSPQGYQLTGLWACWSKYGDFSCINLFSCVLIYDYLLFYTFPITQTPQIILYILVIRQIKQPCMIYRFLAWSLKQPHFEMAILIMVIEFTEFP